MHTTPKWLKGLAVQVAGHGVVSHVGTAGLRALAFKTGLTGALSVALRVPRRLVSHDRGQVVCDLAVVIADGGRAIGHIRSLRDQGELFGPVASTPTAWRCLAEIGDRQLARIDRARAKTRAHVWRQIAARHGRIPSARTCYGDLGKTDRDPPGRLDRDRAFRQGSAPGARSRGRTGTIRSWPCVTTPVSCWWSCCGPGNAGSNTGCDHVKVLDSRDRGDPRAVPAGPAGHHRRRRRRPSDRGHILSAFNARPAPVHYSIGFDLDERARTAITRLPARPSGNRRWTPTATPAPTRRRRTDRPAARIGRRGQLPLAARICGCIVRREPDSRAGCRSPCSNSTTATATRSSPPTPPPGGQSQRLEARHRVHARVEDVVRPPRPPGFAGSRPSPGASTRPGARSSPWPPTCSPGYATSPWTATSPAPNPKPCATGSCTPPPESPAANANAG